MNSAMEMVRVSIQEIREGHVIVEHASTITQAQDHVGKTKVDVALGK